MSQNQGRETPGPWRVWGSDDFCLLSQSTLSETSSSHVSTKGSKLNRRSKISLRYSLISEKTINQNWKISPHIWHEITKDSSCRPERTLKQACSIAPAQFAFKKLSLSNTNLSWSSVQQHKSQNLCLSLSWNVAWTKYKGADSA